MTEFEALKILKLTESDIPKITMVSLSRQFARIKMELEEDSEEYEKLFDAFEYVKANYVSIKGRKDETFPEDFFPTINTSLEERTQVGMILNLTVEGLPTEISFVKAGDKDVFITMPQHTETQDTIVFMFGKHIYEGSLYVKDITQQEHEEYLAGCQNL